MNGLVCGIGINDSPIPVTKKINGKLVWICPIYRYWKGMFGRCYNKATHNNQPTYKGCSVHEDWHTYSRFKEWVLSQDWKGKQLDKDILFVGNKLYSADTCVFVNKLTNSFILDSAGARGNDKIGVFRNGINYLAFCKDPFKRYKSYLGTFKTEEEAHEAWLSKKLEYAYEIVELESDIRVKEAIINRYKNYNKKPDNS